MSELSENSYLFNMVIHKSLINILEIRLSSDYSAIFDILLPVGIKSDMWMP